MNVKVLLSEFFHGDFEYSLNEKILDDYAFVIPEDEIIAYIRTIISIPYEEFLYFLISWQLPKIEAGDLTQSSSFSAAEIEMCEALLNEGNPGLEFLAIGKLFPQYCKKTESDYALRKYGENQVKTAKQLGLTFCYFNDWYLNCFGYVYHLLSDSEKQSLLARTILRDPLYGTMMKDLLFKDIKFNDYLIGLSDSTIKRRLPGIKRILRFAIKEARSNNIDLGTCIHVLPTK